MPVGVGAVSHTFRTIVFHISVLICYSLLIRSVSTATQMGESIRHKEKTCYSTGTDYSIIVCVPSFQEISILMITSSFEISDKLTE